MQRSRYFYKFSLFRYSLEFFNETHRAGLKKPVWHDLCVDLPPESGSLERFRVSLGHKASVLHSHWSRIVESWLSLVKSFIVMLRQLSYAINNQLDASKVPYYYSRPDAIKNQRKARITPQWGYFVPKPVSFQ